MPNHIKLKILTLFEYLELRKERLLLSIGFFGIIFHLIDYTRPVALQLTPFVMTFGAILVVNQELARKNRKFVIAFLLIFIFTLLIEALGVKYGEIFGEYIYGDVLGFKIFEVPIVISIYWVIIIFGCLQLADTLLLKLGAKETDSNRSKVRSGSFTTGKYLGRAFIAGILAVFLDLFLEVMAVKLDYWNWYGNDVPVKNYFAWFAITFFAAILLQIYKVNINSKIFEKYFLGQLVFISVLAVML